MLAHLHTVSVYIFATNRQHNFEKMITIHVTIQGGYVRYYRHANILYIKPFSAVHQHFCFFSHISDTVTNQHAAVSCSDSRFVLCVCCFLLLSFIESGQVVYRAEENPLPRGQPQHKWRTRWVCETRKPHTCSAELNLFILWCFFFCSYRLRSDRKRTLRRGRQTLLSAAAGRSACRPLTC